MKVSLASLAEAEGMKPKATKTIADWLTEHPEMPAEIKECRALGYSWMNIVGLLRKHHQFPFNDKDGLRAAIEK